ncbi:MAG: hypothetical protein F4030_00710 [Gammaproteobacteria bacterium]|nr:hypothetical protein [Gammaproteobacteria bacterium]MYH46362.1 hypothetical protein [Gammaproteobacteria bacterium]MYH84290.1 hypothetical protein [Gammaproteobacteria bacterium]MYK03491.1 hypothetical protein [Gammaproteobacteria bacterium]MYL14161.1 hypothetical protein [Gammaproteobacteria bacterium]
MKNIKIRPFAFFMFCLFAICFVAVAFVTATEVRDVWSALKIAYQTMPILLIVWFVFVLHAWQWPVFSNWLVPFPCLDGTWHGHIQTTWKHPETGEVPGPIPVLLTIRQTFCRISCVMRTAEMTSRSYFADFWIDNDEQVRKLAYCYTSTPSVLVPDRSQPHDGAMLFEIIGQRPQKLRGNYWTTRKTTGEVTLTFRCRERLEDLPSDFGSHPMKGK